MAENADANENSAEDVTATWKHDVAVAVASGIGAAVVTGIATFAVGQVTQSEARVLVEAILPTSRFLCSAVMTATATILALMLTLLGLTIKSEQNLGNEFYRRIREIAFYDMIVLVVATCFLVIHCIPITKSDSIPEWWYSAVYYGLLLIAAMIGGALVSIVVMLYSAIREVIMVLGLEKQPN